MMVDEDDRELEDLWESEVEVEYVDRMFDDPLFVDPAEAEAFALRDLEEGRVVEGELQAALAASINRLDRVLRELNERYEPGERNLEFSMSRASAPLMGLRDALEFALAELRGRVPASYSLVRLLDWVLDLGRQQLVELGAVRLLPEMAVPTPDVPVVSGRAAFEWWWEVAVQVERAYVRAAYQAPGFMTAEALMMADGRLDARRADSAGERLVGGQLRLMGLIRGLALLREVDAGGVESGVRVLISSWMGEVGPVRAPGVGPVN